MKKDEFSGPKFQVAEVQIFLSCVLIHEYIYHEWRTENLGRPISRLEFAIFPVKLFKISLAWLA